MVNCGRRREAALRLTGRLLFILSLLSLIDQGEPQSFEEPLEIALGKFQEILNIAVRKKKAEQSRDEIVSTLLEEARSLTNKEQLEAFKQNLQKAVDEAHKLKNEDKNNTLVISSQLKGLFPHLFLQLESIKKMSKFGDPLLRQMEDVIEHALGKALKYIPQKAELYAGEAENTGGNLDERSNAPKTLLGLHGEL